MAGTEQPETSSSKSERTRLRLLDAAAAVLASKGFAGTRLSDIAELVKLRTPAIYYYYSSREELIEEVMYAGAESMHRHTSTALAQLPVDSTPSERIAAAVEAHLRIELQLSDYSRAIIRNANQLPPEINKRALAEVSAYYNLWRVLIEDLERAGQLRPELSPPLARMLVLGALNWATEWWQTTEGPLEPLIATAQSMIIHSLRR